jgi:hypothetical protein
MAGDLSPDDLWADAEAVIAACDGDPRAAVRVLLVVNNHLEGELERIKKTVSPGFVRGRMKSEPPPV